MFRPGLLPFARIITEAPVLSKFGVSSPTEEDNFIPAKKRFYAFVLNGLCPGALRPARKKVIIVRVSVTVALPTQGVLRIPVFKRLLFAIFVLEGVEGLQSLLG